MKAEISAFINKLMDGKVYTIFMTFLTIYALFGDDVRMLSIPAEQDTSFYAVTIVAIFFFALEIGLSSLAKPDYFLGFYFWLDCVATVSLLFDLGWVWEYMVDSSSSGS